MRDYRKNSAFELPVQHLYSETLYLNVYIVSVTLYRKIYQKEKIVSINMPYRFYCLYILA